MKVTDANYCGHVFRISSLHKFDNMDNCVGTSVFGYDLMLSKDAQPGQLYILFPPETQLSNDYCAWNNLYSHKDLNKDTSKSGYFGTNRRVRAIKLRGNRSTAIALPISSLLFTGVDVNTIKENDQFNIINDIEICRKFVVRTNTPRNKTGKRPLKKFERITTRTFPEHFSTAHFLRSLSEYKDDDEIIVTEKLHGTSARFTHAYGERKLKWYEKIASYFFNISNKEWDYFYGSRKVIKNQGSKSFYQEDVWYDTFIAIKHLIPKNYVIYGEIIGWVNSEKKIQKHYAYRLPPGERKFLVYRISFVNDDGIECDLSWDQLKEFCNNKNLEHVPEIWRGRFSDFDYSIYTNKDFVKDLKLTNCHKLDDGAPCSEGVIIRKEGMRPLLTKYKSPDFLLMETDEADKGNISIEDIECIPEGTENESQNSE